MKKLQSLLLIAIVSIGLGISTNAAVKDTKTPVKPPVAVKQQQQQEYNYQPANSLDIVANPTKYLNKRVKIIAQFDKFSSLGLDYKPAFKSSEKYITFLIKRGDVIDHTIPLSELKNFLSRDIAEKYIDLKPGDNIEYSGLVFSNALGDAWIDVEKFTVLKAESTKCQAAPLKNQESIKK